MTKKRHIEFAIQRRKGGYFEDIDLFNTRTCNWKEPIEMWVDIIKDTYMWRRTKEKFKSARLVKRVTTEEVV